MKFPMILLTPLLFSFSACNGEDDSGRLLPDETETDYATETDTGHPDGIETDADSVTGTDQDTGDDTDSDGCPDDPQKTEPGLCGCGQTEGTCDDTEPESGIVLNLRFHIMRDITFHVQGVAMDNDHITPDVVTNELLPELNKIWDQAEVTWKVESIIEENVIKSGDFEKQKSIVENAVRDAEGHSDPARLPPLYGFMDPEHRSTQKELDSNLFHIYMFPFIGNTSQGNAMRDFGFHTIVGTWSNKSNSGGIPIRRQYLEDWNRCIKGSLARTMAHELGHVLSLTHGQCSNCLMMSCGYAITDAQIEAAQAEAKRRME